MGIVTGNINVNYHVWVAEMSTTFLLSYLIRVGAHSYYFFWQESS